MALVTNANVWSEIVAQKAAAEAVRRAVIEEGRRDFERKLRLKLESLTGAEREVALGILARMEAGR